MRTVVVAAALTWIPAGAALAQPASILQPASVSVPHARDQAEGMQPNANDCTLPEGWAEIEARRPEFVIFGEFHGTRQSPAFVGRVACALAARGKHVLLAVEFPAAADAALQTAWALPHGRFASAVADAGWAGRRDGVASEAMSALLVRLHALKENGANIRIAAFNGPRDERQREKFAPLPGQGPHEAAQAENIADAFSAADYDIALVLVGESHARKRPIDRAGAVYEPMALRLVNAGTVVSLRMRSAGGTAWNCQLKPGFRPAPGRPVTDEAVECADHPIPADGDLRREPFVTLAAFPGGHGNEDYDGSYWLGAISSAPPAYPGR